MNPDIDRYIKAIRNQGKRAYAQQYWVTRCMGSEAPNYHAYGIGAMAEQAVRMNIDALQPMRRGSQKTCDIGLFSDEANQLDLIEMLQEPIED